MLTAIMSMILWNGKNGGVYVDCNNVGNKLYNVVEELDSCIKMKKTRSLG
jgi:hypothetical protein